MMGKKRINVRTVISLTLNKRIRTLRAHQCVHKTSFCGDGGLLAIIGFIGTSDA